MNELSGLLPAYLAGTLDEPTTQAVRSALQESPELQADLRFWTKMKELVVAEARREAAGHLSADVVLDYIEGRILNNAVIEAHLSACEECREDVDVLRSTYEEPLTTSPAGRKPGLMETLLLFFAPPRLGYTLAFLTLLAIASTLTLTILTNRPPEWKRHLVDANRNAANGNVVEAGALYERALSGSSINTQRDGEAVAGIMDSLAIIRLRQGRFGEADSLLRRSFAVREANHLGRTLQAAWSLEELGNLSKLAANDPESERLYRRADAIREEVARNDPGSGLDRYLRNIAVVQLFPRISSRGELIPSVTLDDSSTHLSFLIRLRGNRQTDVPYFPTLTTPAGHKTSLPDTLFVDPLHPEERTVRLTLSRRFFEVGSGKYRIGLQEESGAEEVYEVSISTGATHH